MFDEELEGDGLANLIGRLRAMQGMGDEQLKSLMDGVGPQAADEIERLRDLIESERDEALEQARLLGMGSEREAALMAKLDIASASNGRLRWLLRQIMDALPANRDWLDPQLESEAIIAADQESSA
ncbi:hypothetical protein [Aromatoleum aromaticum]|uniref:hypothetical protein n=1 Tax=Aromatoleum aromaticum TaxID=551760 RepID=UPI0005A26BFC|nr:hypothetical protein [Aromatoleum aromaticum]